MAGETSATIPARLPAVDGLRGLLALVVVLWHATEPLQGNALLVPANLAVCGFFVLSGYVLTRGWDASLPEFLVRRFVRLWPAYAVCLTLAFAVAGAWPQWTLYAWWPVVSPAVDPPIWSLCVEAVAMPFMPLFVLAGRGRPVLVAAALAAGAMALGAHWRVGYATFFVAGAFLSRWAFRNRWLESPIPQALGQISYSLYLSHWILMSAARSIFGPWGALMSVPLAFPLAWALWRAVEAPSIEASRALRRRLRAIPAAVPARA
jgi:peptidoglycan/LPS O-acetylase OafA/YrhL